jgi:hypothetical protein
MFDDLPEELAKALLEKNLYTELIWRPIQRPFSDEELAGLKSRKWIRNGGLPQEQSGDL